MQKYYTINNVYYVPSDKMKMQNNKIWKRIRGINPIKSAESSNVLGKEHQIYTSKIKYTI